MKRCVVGLLLLTLIPCWALAQHDRRCPTTGIKYNGSDSVGMIQSAIPDGSVFNATVLWVHLSKRASGQAVVRRMNGSTYLDGLGAVSLAPGDVWTLPHDESITGFYFSKTVAADTLWYVLTACKDVPQFQSTLAYSAPVYMYGTSQIDSTSSTLTAEYSDVGPRLTGGMFTYTYVLLASDAAGHVIATWKRDGVTVRVMKFTAGGGVADNLAADEISITKSVSTDEVQVGAFATQ